MCFLSLFVTLAMYSVDGSFPKTCDIEAFYSAASVSRGTLVLTSRGELEEVDFVLDEISLDKGKYVVEITRKAQNLYKVDGKNFYIKTRYCHEYAQGQEVALSVEGSYGYNKGKIIF